MGNVLGVVARGCVELTLGCRSFDGHVAHCSRLQRSFRASRVPAHCRQRNWCGLNHKLATHQFPRTETASGTEGTYQNCRLALLESWLGTWWHPCPNQYLATVENVDQSWCIGHPGNRSGTWSAWRIQLRRVVVERRKQHTIRAGPKDGLCRPGCKVMEWDSWGNGGKKRLLFKGRSIKSKLQRPRTLLSSQVVPFREFQD